MSRSCAARSRYLPRECLWSLGPTIRRPEVIQLLGLLIQKMLTVLPRLEQGSL